MLSIIIYDNKIGSFLSFQEADNYYYFFNEKNRKKQKSPHVIKNIYITNLAVTLNYFLDLIIKKVSAEPYKLYTSMYYPIIHNYEIAKWYMYMDDIALLEILERLSLNNKLNEFLPYLYTKG